MQLPLPFYIGLRYTAARRKSQMVSFLSAISISGLVVGVGLLIVVLSVMNGFDRELRERILGLVPQAVINERGGLEDWQSLRQQLEQDPDIVAATPFVQLNGLINHRKNTTPVMLYGVDPEIEYSLSLIHEYVDKNTFYSLNNSEPGILLGKILAEQLQVAVTDKVMLVMPGTTHSAATFGYFQVRGIIESNTELDNSLAITSLEQASALSSTPGRVTGLRLKLDDLFIAPEIVYQNLIKLGPNYSGSNWTRTYGNLYEAIRMSKSLVGLLMFLIVAIAAFNVISTLVMVVIDKQSDIAILRTLGASTKKIIGIFMVQGSTIGLIGTSIGIIAGCLLSLVAEDLVRLVESLFNVQFLKSDVYPLTYLPTEILLTDILRVGFIAFAMSFFAALYPAWKASKVEPAEALRYE